ncbi:unnamed protein product [Rotaria magnacalcarata]|uniref:DNA-directed primase/polymerase protein n=1 Tax=Rotaria magnacalcarata TaxID=392030 RepID=A0A8S2QX43_9BILA|nr:unnamed protein product [Rotaria magnacalcarata]
MKELIILYKNTTGIDRNLYEIIIATNPVKAYIDFEYYVDNNLEMQNHYIGSNCCLKIFHYLLNFTHHTHYQSENHIDLALEEFLVLEAYNTQKISYHFIHANPNILFENNITLGIFIKTFIHFLLQTMIQHKCAFFNIDFKTHKTTIHDLIQLISPYITVLRTHCNECYLFNNRINIAEIAHLLVLNRQNKWTLAIDINVYSRNQQFRLFDCAKYGKN